MAELHRTLRGTRVKGAGYLHSTICTRNEQMAPSILKRQDTKFLYCGAFVDTLYHGRAREETKGNGAFKAAAIY